jgi:hypothetical protein
LVTASQSVAGLFLKTGTVIASTKIVFSPNRQPFIAHRGDITGGLPIRLFPARTFVTGRSVSNRRGFLLGTTL